MQTAASRHRFWGAAGSVVRRTQLAVRAVTVIFAREPEAADRPDATVQWFVRPYLLPHERSIIAVRRHPAVLLRPASVLAATVVVAVLLSVGVLPGGGLFLVLAWGAGAVLALYLVFAVFEWMVLLFVATERRLIFIRGISDHVVATIPLEKFHDVTLRRSALGRLFGYGALIFDTEGSAGELQVIKHIPYPQQIYLEISHLISPDQWSDDET